MRKVLVLAVAAFSITWLASAPGALAGAHRLGAGANYWKTINHIDAEDVKGDIDKDGISWLASYQYAPVGIFKFEFDLEYYPRLGGEKTLWSPEAFVLVGGTLYAGAGVGVYYNGDIFSDTPFFILRAGIDVPILPFISLDINANYRFNDWNTLEKNDLDTDTIRLGAAVRFAM